MWALLVGLVLLEGLEEFRILLTQLLVLVLELGILLAQTFALKSAELGRIR